MTEEELAPVGDLRPGDELKLGGRWLQIIDLRATEPGIFVTVDDDEKPAGREFIFAREHWHRARRQA